MAIITLTIRAEHAENGINRRFTMSLTAGSKLLTTRTGDRNAVIGNYQGARTAAAKSGHTLTVDDLTGDFILSQDGASTISLKIATTPQPGSGIDAAEYLAAAIA